MDKDSAAGPDRAGVRWLLLAAFNDLRSIPCFSGLERLSLVVHKIAARDFTTHVSYLLSAENLLPLDKGDDKVRPIAIGIILRRLATRSLIPDAVAESKQYLYPLHVVALNAGRK